MNSTYRTRYDPDIGAQSCLVAVERFESFLRPDDNCVTPSLRSELAQANSSSLLTDRIEDIDPVDQSRSIIVRADRTRRGPG